MHACTLKGPSFECMPLSGPVNFEYKNMRRTVGPNLGQCANKEFFFQGNPRLRAIVSTGHLVPLIIQCMSLGDIDVESACRGVLTEITSRNRTTSCC
jgi:hypothetical protein